MSSKPGAGQIAPPRIGVSPIEAVKSLWGGALPAFDNLDAVNEVMQLLGMGLWNTLTRHQQRSAPFWLLRVDIPQTKWSDHVSLWILAQIPTPTKISLLRDKSSLFSSLEFPVCLPREFSTKPLNRMGYWLREISDQGSDRRNSL